MGQKLIVPVAFVVLAVAAGVAIYFLMQGDSPRTVPETAQNAPESGAPKGESRPLSMADFDVARVKPDPVKTERPMQVYTAPKTTTRVVISGRVVDESGVGIADARVHFKGASKLHGMKGTGHSDAGGNYRLLAWAPNVANSGDPMGMVSAETAEGRIAVGDTVSIADGAIAEMPDLVFTAVAHLEGQVVTDSGEPAPGAQVTVRSAGPVVVPTISGREPAKTRRQFVTTAISDETGRYSFRHLPPGKYQLTAEAGYFGVSGQRPEVDLTTTSYAWQDVQLENKAFVRGVLKDDAGNTISGAVVKLTVVKHEPPQRPEGDVTQPEKPPTDLKPVRDLRDNVAGFRNDDVTARASVLGERRALTDSAGRFGFSGVVDGELKLEAKLGDAEARLEGVKIDQPDYSMQIEVKTFVAGIVRDAETGLPVEFYDARATLAAVTGDSTPFDRVAEDGRFEYHPAGTYMIPNPLLAAGLVRISAPGYMPATVSTGELREGDAKRDLDVTLKPLCELSFELTRDGRRLDLEPVALVFDDRLAYEASSDQLGRVRIPGVAPATYRVKVTLADGTQLEADLEVPATRKATLEAKLSPGK